MGKLIVGPWRGSGDDIARKVGIPLQTDTPAIAEEKYLRVKSFEDRLRDFLHRCGDPIEREHVEFHRMSDEVAERERKRREDDSA